MWTEPFWLLALCLAPPLLWLAGFTFGYFKPAELKELPSAKTNRNLKLITGLRVAAVVMVVLALAGTWIPLPTKNQQTVIVFDVSDSIGRPQIEESRDAVLRFIRGMPAQDQVAVVDFSGEARVLTSLVEPQTALQVLESAPLATDSPHRSNLQAALRVGIEMLKERHGNRRILFLTDGRPTEGGSITAALTGSAKSEIPIYSIPIGATSEGFIGRSLEIPELIHPGERIPVHWKISAGLPQNIKARIKLDGKVVGTEPITIFRGNNTIPLILGPQTPGIHRLEVEAVASNGQILPQSLSGAILKIGGPAKILIAYNELPVAALSRALRIQGMEVVEKNITEFPETPEALDNYSAVILDNIPAPYLTEVQQDLLHNYVAGGGGLLVIGGDSSLGRGEYFATRLEEMLPVETDSRQRLIFNRAMILFVIDQSGSMSEIVGKTSKLTAALQGVAAAVNELNPQDEVGLLAFDSTPTWVLPFTSAGRKTEIMEAIGQLGSEGGGTDMAAAIREVIQQFSTIEPIRRHVIFLTDGLTGDSDFQLLSTRLKKLGVTITTIGIGEEINQSLLQNIAKWGEGKFYRADLDKIPQIFQKEIIRVTRDLIQEGLFYPQVQTQAAFLNDLTLAAPNLPPLAGYLITKPKSFGAIYLNTGKNDPLLSAWRYGNGQVAVFTSDSGSRWLAPWLGSKAYNLLWSRTVRLIERSGPAPGLRVAARVEADNGAIVAEAIGPDHRLKTGLLLTGRIKGSPGQSFILKETAPGRYEASVPLSGSGIQQFEIYNPRSHEWAPGWVWKPAGAEFSELSPNLELLKQVSEATGGSIISFEEMMELSRNSSWAPYDIKLWLIILALLLVLVELGYRSMSLGQMKMARAVFEAWWAIQLRLIELVRGTKKEEEDTGREHQQTMDAYRYLAQKGKGTKPVDS